MHKLQTAFVSSLAFLLAGSTALAQNPANPSFGFEKPPEKPADWKVQSKGGGLLTTGNSQSRVGTAAIDASRQSGENKISFNAAATYGRSQVLTPVVTDGLNAPTVYDLQRVPATTTNEWKTRGRYDRFVTPNNSVYGLSQLGADKVAGKRLYGGAQVGYSRQLLKNERHTAVVEAGYDFSYESYVQSAGKTLEAVAIHSARLFVGELLTLTPDTGINGSLEALFNLNKESGALDVSDATGNTKGVKAFKDTRLIGKAGISTRLYKSLSIGFSFALKYDQNPAPRPMPKLPVALAGQTASTYGPGVSLFADKVDTLTEATLIYTFL